jgi:AraC-like DNA-binding protein
MTPKQFARVLRFKRHYRALISHVGARRSLSADLEGFYDQSHFNREFRHFTGVAPGAKLAGRMTLGMKVADHLLASDPHAGQYA